MSDKNFQTIYIVDNIKVQSKKRGSKLWSLVECPVEYNQRKFLEKCLITKV